MAQPAPSTSSTLSPSWETSLGPWVLHFLVALCITFHVPPHTHIPCWWSVELHGTVFHLLGPRMTVAWSSGPLLPGGREKVYQGQSFSRFSLCAFCAFWSPILSAAPQGTQAHRALCVSSPPSPSVASAMHGDSHDRYERLTSVSSSVDFDQRDNVSTLPTNVLPLPLECWGCSSRAVQLR